MRKQILHQLIKLQEHRNIRLTCANEAKFALNIDSLIYINIYYSKYNNDNNNFQCLRFETFRQNFFFHSEFV